MARTESGSYVLAGRLSQICSTPTPNAAARSIRPSAVSAFGGRCWSVPTAHP
jgi:hypothetical protein